MSEIDERDRLHQEDLERIRNFRLMDDDFLTKCFENNVDATKLMLDIILPVKLTVEGNAIGSKPEQAFADFMFEMKKLNKKVQLFGAFSYENALS